MIQLAKAMDVFLGGYAMDTRSVKWSEFQGVTGEAGSVVDPTYGGGIPWKLRMQTVFGGRGSTFVRRTRTLRNRNLAPGNDTKVWFDYDAIMLRIMHGWIEIKKITEELIIVGIMKSNEVFGVETVILLTIPFTNNVVTPSIWEMCQRANEIMCNVSNTWHARDEEEKFGVRNILVMEYGMYNNHLIWTNGRNLGYDVSHPLDLPYGDRPFMNESAFLFDRLTKKYGPAGTLREELSPSITMVCNDWESLYASKNATCNRNRLFRDGMHVCSETFGHRYGVVVACLLGCVYNRNNANDSRTQERIRACERSCNWQFMSVRPIEEGWLGSTLGAFV